MDEFFKPTCSQGENPLGLVINSLIAPNPGEIPMQVHQDVLHDIWEESEAQLQQDFEAFWQGQPEPDHEAIWQDISHKATLEENWPPEYDYKSEMEDYIQSFNSDNKKYTFESSNPFLATSDCYQQAIIKEKSGLSNEAILLLEAEVQQNPQNSEAWCMLGRLHAKNDEDTRAIAAMLRGLEVDPYNLELLMYLGISCTNEFDEDQALMYLKTWLQHHPMYSEIPVNTRQNLRDDIFEAFRVAVSMNPSDSDVFQAIGVLSYLSSDFPLAEDNFRKALILKQDDAAIWNRLGAALAKQGRIEEAFECYHKALEIKPDFVRTWGNLGLAYSNIKDYENSARFSLCALSLNPKAEHLYSYVTSAFIFMNRMDLLEKLTKRDPSLFRDDFQIITRENLPKSSQWVDEFNNN